MYDLRSYELASAMLVRMRQESKRRQEHLSFGRPVAYKPRRKPSLYSRMMVWLGAQLINWGRHLQANHDQDRTLLRDRPAL